MNAVTALERDLADARYIAEERAAFDAARAGRPERWAPAAARTAWEAAVRGVHTRRGGDRGVQSLIAAAAGVAPSSIHRIVHT